jgi:hypothetical protein
MDLRVKLQIRLLIIIVKLIDGIHLKDDLKKELDGFIQSLKESN